MKKIASIFFSFMAFVLCLGVSGCNSGGINDVISSTDISIDGFVKENDKLSGKVNNDVESFSFINKVSVAKGSTWKVYSDVSGTQEIVTKTVNLSIGDNLSYILVTAKNGELGFYNVNVRRFDIYTVHFNTDGGTFIEDQRIQEESFVNPVENPIRTGFDFNGWDYDFSNPVMCNLTINAIWSGHKHTVSFDMNGADSSPIENMNVTYGDYVSLPNPTRTGYKFDGWYKDDRRVSSGFWSYDEDVVLTAKWTGNTYRVKYNANGGSVIVDSSYSPSTYQENVQFGSDYTLKNAKLEGYDLAGWYYGDTKVESGKWSIPNDVTLVASWSSKKYTISYDVNGGEALTKSTQDVFYNEPYELVKPSRKGYSFEGWLNNGEAFEDGIWTYTNNIQLVASWSANTYAAKLNTPSTKCKYYVIFDLNYDDLVVKKEFSPNDILEFYVPETRSGYAFYGWYTDKELKNIFIFDKTLNNGTTLYAKWEERNVWDPNPLLPGYSFSGEAEYIMGGGGPSYRILGVLGLENRTYKLSIEGNSADFTVSRTVNAGFGEGPQAKQRTCTLVSQEQLQNGHWLLTYELSGIVVGDLNVFGYLHTTKTKIGAGVIIYSITIDGEITSKTKLNENETVNVLNITYDSDFDLGVPYKNDGKSFVGWFTGSNGTGTKVTDNNGCSLSPWCYDESTNLYAYFI